jgi:hypothetical protein
MLIALGCSAAGYRQRRSIFAALAAAFFLPVTFIGFLNQSQRPEAYAAAEVPVLRSAAGEIWGRVQNFGLGRFANGLTETVEFCLQRRRR